MKDIHSIKDLFLSDPVPIRIGGITSNVARIQSFAAKEADTAILLNLIAETRNLVLWMLNETGPEPPEHPATAATLDADTRTDLTELDETLTEWTAALSADPPQMDAITLSREARIWTVSLMTLIQELN